MAMLPLGKATGKIRLTAGALRQLVTGKVKAPSAYNRCVGNKLFGTRPGKAVRAEFTKAAVSCKGTRTKK